MITLRSLVPEQMENTSLQGLEKESKAFALKLIQTGLISSHHMPQTSADERPLDYAEDLAEVVRNAVIHWVSIENSRGGR